ncbi:probable inactive DNA (cytosine-5)-methyltransferase DRM3 isoform X2 [Macadamia integrifolia]|uniref:probable inactive DNA (cytosine-5)-methyltransferase DRM3 isoform X2 n=1 Tax=Macadamia integrifolia TaxID=60698 RepID=UPI001C4EB660|nr:probable inactive DNA (cytosine-5)-methyltransferase DRM3 isoform X2 [Macadamia integrifolia]XP_042516039.1 probable inactive DNA (cytosine-5)-methyltransferase DRM3 isoform X2 [Macadamia integrifolia]
MCLVSNDSESLSDWEVEEGSTSKLGILDLDLSTGTECSKHSQGNHASSSGSNLKSYFIGMGFSPTLVDKVIEENGDENMDLLLETLFAKSALKKSSSESSDSLDALFSSCSNGVSSPECATDDNDMEELNVSAEFNEDKRASLLMMNFSMDDVESAIHRLGEGASINELVDFIVAAQITESSGKEITTEALFGTMDKTLRLLEMGFSENEISSAIERLGTEVPVCELADSIFADRLGSTCGENDKESTLHDMHFSHTESDWRSLGRETEYNQCHVEIKIEETDWSYLGRETGHNKRSPEVKIEETEVSDSNVFPRTNEINFEKIGKGKKPKHECEYDSTFFDGSTRPEARIVEPSVDSYRMPLPKGGLHRSSEPLEMLESKPNWCSSVNQMLAKPPYFFYGNVMDVSHDYWARVSQYLYLIEPEFVNSQFFSALSRKEGYIHNLSNDNRVHILPRPPMTIEDAIPHTRKWWPSWDTRKQLSCISSETAGISQLCDRLGKILVDSKGMLSTEQQRDILHHCKTLNLIWVGKYKLNPIEPDQVERILGYPLHHTLVAGCDPNERLGSLKHCFQTDTLGYHISVLKRIFPGGLTMLSLYSGIGGAEVALQRLGIRLKGVVSVESSATNRKILKKWWLNTAQTGKLLQIEDIHRLTTSKLESLIKEFGGFDFVICQNPCCCISGSSKMAADGDNPAGLDFQLFYEFVRVLLRVRSSMGRNR